MKNIMFDNIEYKLIKNYKDAFDLEEFNNKMTDYFSEYDYIVGDWSYGKLRLKGFCKKGNKKISEINDYSKVDQYIKNNCAYECKNFVLEKIKTS